MNKDTFEGKWKELRGDVRKQWGKLTNDDVEKIAGSYEQLVGKIQQKYAVAKDEAKKMVERW